MTVRQVNRFGSGNSVKRVDDDAHQAAMRARIEAEGARPTPVIDRFWFKSVYFKEPGGVLFELVQPAPSPH